MSECATTLFAALDVKSGMVIGDCMPRHRAREFLRNIDKAVQTKRDVHLVLDNYATHKAPEVRAWLDKHPRFKLHFTPHQRVLAEPLRTLLRRNHVKAHTTRQLRQRR